MKDAKLFYVLRPGESIDLPRGINFQIRASFDRRRNCFLMIPKVKEPATRGEYLRRIVNTGVGIHYQWEDGHKPTTKS